MSLKPRLIEFNYPQISNISKSQYDGVRQPNRIIAASLMLKTQIFRVRCARDHVYAIICNCDGELRDHEQRPPLILGSATRLSRISLVIRARETCDHSTRYGYPRSESFWFYRLAECRSIRHRDGVLYAATNHKFDSRWPSRVFAGQRSAIDDKFCLSHRTSESMKFILGVRLYPRWK